MTGSGKSSLVQFMLLDLIRRQNPSHPHHIATTVFALDMKGDSFNRMIDFLATSREVLPHVTADSVVTIDLFSDHGVSLNPFHRIESIDPEVQASGIAELLETLFQNGMGPRMRPMATLLCLAILDLDRPGSFLDMLAVLTDEQAAAALAYRAKNKRAQAYVERLWREPASTRDALRARLEGLLLVPKVRAALCSPRKALTGSELLESPLTLVSAGYPPQGFEHLSIFFGRLLFGRLSAAVFARRVTRNTQQAVLVLDEWQNLLGSSGGSAGGTVAAVERLLAMARSQATSLWLINQLDAQISKISPHLLEIITGNVGMEVLFSPSPQATKRLAPLFGLRGTQVDSAAPDRVLGRDAELRMLAERLATQPIRHAVVADHIAKRAVEFRTPTVPYQELDRRLAVLDPEVRRAMHIGSRSVPYQELLMEVDGLADDLMAAPPPPRPAVQSKSEPSSPLTLPRSVVRPSVSTTELPPTASPLSAPRRSSSQEEQATAPTPVQEATSPLTERSKEPEIPATRSKRRRRRKPVAPLDLR
jgi:hypothetical protein